MSSKISLSELENLSDRPSGLRWVHPEEVDFNSATSETAPNELLTDQWSKYLSHRMPGAVDVPVGEIVRDVVELTERFGSSYTIYNLDTYIGYLVGRSPDRAAILERLNGALARAPEKLKQAWSDLITDCNDSSLQRLWR